MNGKGLELIETLAAISRVSGQLARKLAVMAARVEAAEEMGRRAHQCRHKAGKARNPSDTVYGEARRMRREEETEEQLLARALAVANAVLERSGKGNAH